MLTSGCQQVPEKIGAMPTNFHHADHLPGLASPDSFKVGGRV
jgi:hypothetical protein